MCGSTSRVMHVDRFGALERGRVVVFVVVLRWASSVGEVVGHGAPVGLAGAGAGGCEWEGLSWGAKWSAYVMT